MAQINPFQGPINYAVDVQSPFEAAVSGFKVGQAGAEMQAKAEAREQAAKNQMALKDLFKNPNATAADYAQVTAFLPKDQAAIVQSGFEALTKEQQQNTLRVSTQAYTAIKSGNPDMAQMQLQEQAAALRNSAREKEAQGYDDLANLIRLNPTGAQTIIGLNVAQLPGGKDFLDNADKVLATQRQEALQPSVLSKAVADSDKAVAEAETAQATAKNADEKAAADAAKATADANKAKVEARYAEKLQIAGLDEKNWNVKNLRSQISDRSSRLNLDIQKTAAEVADKMSQIKDRLTALPESAQKLVNESAVNASTSKQASDQYTEIAKQLDGLGSSWGALNNLGEWSKSQFGNQDFRTAIQNEYTRLANSAGIKAYKASGATGGFSDADLNTALAGIPKANANPKIMAQFMRGMAKEQAISSALENAKTDWLTQNKGQLGRASGTFLAGDYAVKPGETYADFSARVTKDVVKKFTTPAQSTLVEQIPTDANPRPAAPAANIRSQADAILRGGQ